MPPGRPRFDPSADPSADDTIDPNDPDWLTKIAALREEGRNPAVAPPSGKPPGSAGTAGTTIGKATNDTPGFTGQTRNPFLDYVTQPPGTRGNGPAGAAGPGPVTPPPPGPVPGLGRPGAGGGGGGTFTPFRPAARDAYGPYLSGDLVSRTVGLDEKTRVDPYTGQRYAMGSDGTWRESGFLGRDQATALRATGAMTPEGTQLRDQTLNSGPMSANPGLRGGAGTAGMLGGLGPQDAPHFAMLSDYRMPGLGFSAADYTPMRMSDNLNFSLGSIPLPTPVTKAPYGFDYGGGAQHVPGSTKTTGPAAFAPTPQNFQVPNGYQPGPSGFSQPGGTFKAFAMPFGIQDPTFKPLAQSAPGQIQPNATRDPTTGSFFSPVGPGALQPGGMERPGGAGALWQNGSQTADVRGGGQGMGFNADTILKDYGRAGISSDAATRAQVALALMQENQLLQTPNGQLGSGAHSPLDAYLAMMTPSATNYGAPDGGGSPVGGFGNAGNPGAYGPDGPDRGFARGGTINVPGMPPLAGSRATPSVVAPLDNSTGMAQPRYTPQGQQQAFAGSGVSAPTTQAFASGGTVNVPGMQLPLASGRATPAVVAPLDDSSSSNMAQPRYTPQGQQQAQQATYLDSTAQAAAPSNSEGAISPISNQATTSQAPIQASPQVDQSQFTLDSGAGANDPTGMLNPYRDALAQLGAQARQRSYDSNRYSLAGLSQPTGIDTLGGQAGSALPPGMFWDPSGAIKGRVNDITNLQSTIAGLGNPGSIESLTNQEIPVQNLQQLFTTIQSEQQKLAALGPMGDPTALHAAQDALQAKLTGLGSAQSAQTSLLGLGPQQDLTGLYGQRQTINDMLTKLGVAQGAQTNLTSLGNVGNPDEINTQIYNLKQSMAPYQAIQTMMENAAQLAAPLEGHRSPIADYTEYAKWQSMLQEAQANTQEQPTIPTDSTYNPYTPTENGITYTPNPAGVNAPPNTPGYTDANGQFYSMTDIRTSLANAQNQWQQWQDLSDLRAKIAAADPNGQASSILGTDTTNLTKLQQAFTDAQNAGTLQKTYQNQLTDAGLGSNATAQDVAAAIAKENAALDPVAQSIKNAEDQNKLRSNYSNTLTGLGYDPSTDLASLMGGVQSQLDPVNQSLQNLTSAQDLQSQIANLQGQTAGQTQGGVEAQMTQLQDALSRARQLQSSQSTLSNLVSQGVPGVNPATGKLPGFAQGGNIMSGISQTMGYAGPGSKAAPNMSANLPWPSSVADLIAKGQWGQRFAGGGQINVRGGNQGPPDVQGYQRPPDSSGKNRAEMMRGMGPLGVTMGQWDPNWNIHQNPAHFANGGSMTTPEEIVGIGRFSGKPYFRVGENGMAERLQVTPLHRPESKMPMGVMNRAAA